MNAILAEGFMGHSWHEAVPAELCSGSAAGIAATDETTHLRQLSRDMPLRLTMSVASP